MTEIALGVVLGHTQRWGVKFHDKFEHVAWCYADVS